MRGYHLLMLAAVLLAGMILQAKVPSLVGTVTFGLVKAGG